MPRRIVNRGMGIEKIDLDEGDWVRIRTRQTAGDRAFIHKHSTFMTFNARGEVTHTHFDVGQGNLAALECMLVSWGGPGFCIKDHDENGVGPHDESNGCKSIELTRENIELLSDDDANRIINAINQSSVKPRRDSTNP